MRKIICVIVCLCVFSAVFLCGCSKDPDTVRVHLQAANLTEEELSNLDKFAADNGFDYVSYNKRKGIVTVGIDETDHHNLLFSLGVTVIRNVFGMIESEEYPYVTNVERDKNFRNITVFVKRDECEKAGKQDEIIDYAGNCCLVYLQYTDESEDEKTCLIRLSDEKTGEVIAEKTFSVEDAENANK